MNCGTLPQLEDRLLLLSEPQGAQGAQERQRRGPRRRSSPGGARQGQFCAPRGARRPSRVGQESWKKPGLEPGPSPPRPPRRGLRSLPSSPRRVGRGASTKTPTSERARAHPANSWPRPGPQGGIGQGTLGGRGQARMGRASDPGRRARGWGGGAGGGGRELLPLLGRPEWPKKEFLKIGRNSSEEVGGRKGKRNTPPHP